MLTMCCVCRRLTILGHRVSAPLSKEEESKHAIVSHGYCKECKKAEMEKVRQFEIKMAKRKEEEMR